MEEEVKIEEPTGYLEEDRDTTVLSTPMEDIGQLCNLVPTQNLVRQRWVGGHSSEMLHIPFR